MGLVWMEAVPVMSLRSELGYSVGPCTAIPEESVSVPKNYFPDTATKSKEGVVCSRFEQVPYLRS